jgi:hypothetical protein
MRLASGPQVRRQAKGCDGLLTEAWTEHLSTRRGRNFTDGQRGEEQRKGTGLQWSRASYRVRCITVSAREGERLACGVHETPGPTWQ